MSKLIRRFTEEYKQLFFICLMVGFALYSPIAYQSLWNPDSLDRSVLADNVVWVQQARWGCQLWEDIMRSNYIFPMQSFFISIILLAMISVLVVEIFDIKNKVAQMLLSACVLTSLHQLSTMTYAYCGDEFTIAYFLAVVSAFFLCKMWNEEKGTLVNCICSVICLTICLAMYQAYLAIIIVILGTRFVLELYSDKSWQICLKKIGIQILSLGASVVMYLISIKASLIIYNTELSSYRNIDQVGNLDLATIPKTIRDAYTYFYHYYFTNYLYNNSFRGKKTLHILIIAGILLLLVYLFFRNKKQMNVIKTFLVALSCVLLPIGFNIVHFMTNTGVSFMMIPAIPYLYVILVILIEKACSGNKIDIGIKMMRIPVILVVYISVLLINMLEVELRLDINKAVSIANNIDVDIKRHEDYSKETKILIVGNYNKGNYERVYGDVLNPMLGGTVADFGQFWLGPDLGLSNMNCWNHLFMQYCGTRYLTCNQEEYDNIVMSDEFFNMGIYPQKESMQKINDVLVIKLSDDLY